MFIKEAELLWKAGEPFSKLYQDLYFSKLLAEEESNYVYIDGNDLVNRWKNLEPKSIFNIISFFYYVLHIPYLTGRYPDINFFRKHFYEKKIASLQNLIFRNL